MFARSAGTPTGLDLLKTVKTRLRSGRSTVSSPEMLSGRFDFVHRRTGSGARGARRARPWRRDLFFFIFFPFKSRTDTSAETAPSAGQWSTGPSPEEAQSNFGGGGAGPAGVGEGGGGLGGGVGGQGHERPRHAEDQLRRRAHESRRAGRDAFVAHEQARCGGATLAPPPPPPPQPLTPPWRGERGAPPAEVFAASPRRYGRYFRPSHHHEPLPVRRTVAARSWSGRAPRLPIRFD